MDRFAFGIYVDEQIKVQCYQMVQPKVRPGHVSDVQVTCHTASALHITKGSRVSIRDVYVNRTILLRDECTFWGMVNLA